MSTRLLDPPGATAPTVTPRPAPAPAAARPGPAAGFPPLSLPGGHFLAAVAFLLAGAAGLVAAAPHLAAGNFLHPRVAATTHLFTLGWITTSILAALYQFLPVALGVPIRSVRVAYAGGVLHVAGLAVFVAGVWTARPEVFLPGAAVLGTGLLLFVGNLAAALRRARERGLTWWCLAGAGASLACTVVLGASLAGNLRWGYLGAERMLALGVHLHVAAAGWVMLVIVGVAHRLLPMFLLSHGASPRPERAAAWLLGTGTAALLAAHHFLTPALRWGITALLAAGTAAWLVQAALFFRHGRKPALDAGMRLAACGAGLLGVAVLLGPWAVHHGTDAPRLAAAYGLALVPGGFGLFVAGHFYKVVPSLVWFHRWGPLAGRQKVPTLAELYRPGPAHAAAAALAGGIAGLIAATLLGWPGAARAAALLYAAGALVLAVQIVHIFRRRAA